MKKIFVILGISLALAACGGNKPTEDNKSDSASASNQSAEAQQPNADTSATKIGTDNNSGTSGNKGETLMANSDCNTCHNAQSKIIGPALVDIAKKYKESDVDMLADKIIKRWQWQLGHCANDRACRSSGS
jgi:cytochrome c